METLSINPRLFQTEVISDRSYMTTPPKLTTTIFSVQPAALVGQYIHKKEAHDQMFTITKTHESVLRRKTATFTAISAFEGNLCYVRRSFLAEI